MNYLLEQQDNFNSHTILKNYVEKSNNDDLANALQDYSNFQYFAILYSKQPFNNQTVINSNNGNKLSFQSLNAQTNPSHETEISSENKTSVNPYPSNDHHLNAVNDDFGYITFIQWNNEEENSTTTNHSYININTMDMTIPFMDHDFYIYNWDINLKWFTNNKDTNDSSTNPIESTNRILINRNDMEYCEPQLVMKPCPSYWNDNHEEIYEENTLDDNCEFLESRKLIGLEPESNSEDYPNNNSDEEFIHEDSDKINNDNKNKCKLIKNDHNESDHKIFNKDYVIKFEKDNNNSSNDNKQNTSDKVPVTTNNDYDHDQDNSKVPKDDLSSNRRCDSLIPESTPTTKSVVTDDNYLSTTNYNSHEEYEGDDGDDCSTIKGPSAPLPTPNSSVLNVSPEKESEAPNENANENLNFLQSFKDDIFNEVWEKVNKKTFFFIIYLHLYFYIF